MSLFDAMVTRLEIGLAQPLKEMSSGQRKRMAFALGSATNADLVLSDEVTTGVDPFTSSEMMAAFGDMVESGERTVVFSTHAIDEVLRYADQVMLLSGGQSLGCFEKDALVDAWRVLWLREPPTVELAGLGLVDDQRPTRVLTRSPEELIPWLAASGAEIVRESRPEMTEILAALMAEVHEGSRSDSKNEEISAWHS